MELNKLVVLKQKMPLKIKQVPFGIACRIGNTIYIHKDIKNFSKKLYYSILRHEKAHSRGFSLEDVSMDLNNKHLKNIKKKYYSFVFSHPSSWSEFLPVWRYDDGIALNILLIIFWSISIGILWLIVYFSRFS